MKLNEISVGDSCEVVGLSVDAVVAERLNMLNIGVGAKLLVVRYSPFQSSVLIETGGARVALRTSIAKKINVVRL